MKRRAAVDYDNRPSGNRVPSAQMVARRDRDLTPGLLRTGNAMRKTGDEEFEQSVRGGGCFGIIWGAAFLIGGVAAFAVSGFGANISAIYWILGFAKGSVLIWLGWRASDGSLWHMKALVLAGLVVLAHDVVAHDFEFWREVDEGFFRTQAGPPPYLLGVVAWLATIFGLYALNKRRRASDDE